ncbi:MAG TPA: tRNA (adenosine(37)-N6)-dimethylallyltransferase MiaA [Thermoanaerobaculia bacterium]|nr:tRNA (adenosine(37)-N6)-dimethylallyltransferase MiaA [Thermoanaerobaculia bacterium]
MTAVVVAGPTGSGKSELALGIALARGGEIVNYDSMQIYRGFDIGTAKPPESDRRAVPHHLFDFVDAGHELNAADYARVVRPLIAAIESRRRLPILAGGTFFYLRAILSGLPEMPGRDEALRSRIRRIAHTDRGPARLHRWLERIDAITASRIPPTDRHRVERALEVWMTTHRPISSWERPGGEATAEMPAVKIALRVDRARLGERLDARVDAMYRSGLVEETRALLERFPSTARPFGSIGYREAAAVVAGQLGLEPAIAETKRRTRAYAKRQMTWLRSERNVHWIDATTSESNVAAALRLLREARV